MTDWDASRYHRISQPQYDWGRRVIARLRPRPGERVLDLGCGTGRLTAEIASRTGGARVTALDRSWAMLAVARETAGLDGRMAIVRGDGTALPFSSVFDAVFSAATLHWIHDHGAVFDSVFDALAPGGRFVAQCGGYRNLERLLERTRRMMRAPEFAPYFAAWQEPWYFAAAEPTARQLARAGFVDVATSLEAAPVAFEDAAAFGDFIACVCIRHHLHALDASLRPRFVKLLTSQFNADPEPFVLDYWRLNIDARKPGDPAPA
jgi:trans-aconitate methyltransferase